MTTSWPWLSSIALLSLLVPSCKAPPQAKPEPAAPAQPAASAPVTRAPEPVQVLVMDDVKPPVGTTFKKYERAFATVELPDGGGWKVGADQVSAPDGTVIAWHVDVGVDPLTRGDYLAAYEQHNKKRLPNYKLESYNVGVVRSMTTARVEGTFDNGAASITRDYLVFDPEGVITIAARTPKANADKLEPIVDYVVSTVRAK
ncbi:MAG: hypothetical protein AB7O24_04615 [Kofleriaceae bacterium]